MRFFEPEDVGKRVLITFKVERSNLARALGVSMDSTYGRIVNVSDNKITLENVVAIEPVVLKQLRRITYNSIKSYQFI